ncbi:MAG: hypothetical protein LBI69_04400 [Puniceicoccales bacterium]|jgi:hypothetical protein|nr:hypothetical protein [Puniceicoccales bacterium]
MINKKISFDEVSIIPIISGSPDAQIFTSLAVIMAVKTTIYNIYEKNLHTAYDENKDLEEFKRRIVLQTHCLLICLSRMNSQLEN